ncbi:hypothetical protein JCM5350_005721 [Sporobolomyces pararoseus]
MSISQLPPELLRAILEHTRGEDHLRTCLVSKIWYQETVPLLYEGLSFMAAECATRVWYDTIFSMARGDWAAGTLDMEEIQKKHDEIDKQQRDVMKVFRRNPSYKNYIEKLGIQLFITDPAEEDDTFITEVVKVLRDARNLKHLSLSNYHRYDDPDEWHIQWILRHVPSSVTVLDLRLAFLTAETILKLLARLPNLQKLTLAADFTLGAWTIRTTTVSPKLHYLKELRLISPFQGKTFLEKILSDSSSLEIIYACPISLQALPLNSISSVRQLVVQGDLSRSAFKAYPPSEFVSDLIETLERCPKIYNFNIVATSESYEDIKEEEEVVEEEEEELDSLNLEISKLLVESDFLRYLPSSVTALGIVDTAIVPEYLADYLKSCPSTSQLQIVRFSPLRKKWFGADQDVREDREDTVEDECFKRDIDLEWFKNGQSMVRPCTKKAAEFRKLPMFAEFERMLASFELKLKNQEVEEAEEKSEVVAEE